MRLPRDRPLIPSRAASEMRFDDAHVTRDNTSLKLPVSDLHRRGIQVVLVKRFTGVSYVTFGQIVLRAPRVAAGLVARLDQDARFAELAPEPLHERRRWSPGSGRPVGVPRAAGVRCRCASCAPCGAQRPRMRVAACKRRCAWRGRPRPRCRRRAVVASPLPLRPRPVVHPGGQSYRAAVQFDHRKWQVANGVAGQSEYVIPVRKSGLPSQATVPTPSVRKGRGSDSVW